MRVIFSDRFMNERKSYVQRATKSLNLKQQMKYREVNFSYDVLKKERERERKKKNVSGRKKIHFAWHSMHGYKFAIRQYVIWFTIFFCLKIVEKYDICRTNVQTCIHCCSRNSVLNFSLWKNYLGNAYVPANTNILKIARIFHFSLFLERNFLFFFFFFFFVTSFSIFHKYSTLTFTLQDLSSYFAEFIRLDHF